MESKIIICEDNNIIALDIKNELQLLGYHNSITLNCGEDLIEYLNKGIPSLIIIDIKLGGKIKGLEAIKTILPKYSIPIIILNGFRDQLHPELLESPKVQVIKKPFDLQDFKAAIDKLFDADPV